MSKIARMMQQATAGAAGAGLDVDEVFSTHLYDGNSGTQTITNGIDLSSEGGLVWVKRRDGNLTHALFDTERGVGKLLQSNLSNSEYGTNTPGDDLTNFNSNGFTLGDGQFTSINYNSYNYVSWTFRKAPKFFDVVKYDGSSSAQTIAHNLGVTPAVMIVKQLNGSGRWTVYHKDASPTGNPQNGRLALNTTDAWNEYPTVSSFNTLWNQTAPTSTHFTVGTNATTGANGSKYVAYLFANNNNDGEFGPNADQDIIKCGSVTIDGTGNATVNLGFEPQWLLIRNASSSGYDWQIFDTMRGFRASPDNGAPSLSANSTSGDSGQGDPNLTSTGFEWDGGGGQPNKNYIYIAIRRPIGTEPTSATDVFAMDGEGGDGVVPSYDTTFPVDMVFRKEMNASGFGLWDRIRGGYRLKTHNSEAQDGPFSYATFDHMDGFAEHGAVGNSVQSWMFKRAPGFFEQVLYTGTGSARTIAHPLQAVPQMIWCKRLDASQAWQVYHAYSHPSTPQNYFFELDADNSAADSGRWNNTAPTDSVFSLGSEGKLNTNGEPYIAYLFGEISGISKFGSYTGNGTGQNIDCGFSNGARFVLIKTTTVYRGWVLFDTYRGIVSGNDSYVMLNESSAQNTSKDIIDPYAAGFAVSGSDALNNSNGETYTFWAIA